MISHISIRDFAIIENIGIDLHEGLEIITGETGSGKSIIIEAVSLAFGARADKTMVRTGKDKALIQVIVDEENLPMASRSGIELISREISVSGKSICRINGEIVTLSQLAEASSKLADIHGQYDHQSLFDTEKHLDLIDSFRADIISPILARVSAEYAAYDEARRDLNALLAQEAMSRRELDFVKYEVDEIEKAHLVSGEHAELKDRISVMQNSETIYAALSEADTVLSSGDVNAMDGIAHALKSVQTISAYGAAYEGIEKDFSEAYYALEDVAKSVRRELEQMDFSQQSIDEAIARLDLIDRLAAKYCDLPLNEDVEVQLLSYLDKAKEKLDNFENIDARKAELTLNLQNAAGALAVSSRELSAARQSAAETLSALILEQLGEMNFKDAAFSAVFEELPPDDGALAKRFGPNGADTVEFLFSANKGQSPRPIAKVASGGEMSRVMLAIRTVTGDFDQIPTMIFDEIDTGISGVTASVVGEKLKRMSTAHQIICITHLPQIAAFANHHYLIAKSSDDKQVYTTVSEVEGEERVAAISRLIGGRAISPAAIETARELINSSR